jgi:hypothetical protein
MAEIPSQVPVEIKVGQIWQDRDKRMGGRRRFVEKVTKTHAVLRHMHFPTSKTVIRLDNLRKRWRLVPPVKEWT